MRPFAAALIVLAIALQYPLWFGKGGWLRVRDLDQRLESQRGQNAALVQRNAALSAEVRDLKTGLDAIEERARVELGMIKRDEVFFHVLDSHVAGAPAQR
jgi:cell division protein FtsB